MNTQIKSSISKKSINRTEISPIDSFLLRCQVDGLATSTLRSYTYVLRSFRKYLGQNFINEVTANKVRRYLGELRDSGASQATLAVHYRVLSVFFNFMVTEGLIFESPLVSVSKPRLPKRFPHCLEEHQVNELLKQCDMKTFEGQRNHVMILTFLGTGLRLGELIKLNADTVNLTERAFRITGKGDKERLVFFGPRLVRELRRYKAMRAILPGSEYQNALFITAEGARLKPRNVHMIISRLGKKAGITGVRVSPHTLRHTFATRYISNGGDPYALQELLGHSDPKTTMVYVHMTGKRLREAFIKADPLGEIG